MSDVVVRELSTVAECAAITPLTWQVWGPNAPVFSVDLLRAIGHTGGYLAGAFLDAGAGGQEAGAGEQEMVGFSLGLLADLNGARSLHSHAIGVLAHARGLHVGLALKEHQRAWAHGRGIPTITWTYDPLVRRNATFNLLRLGASPQLARQCGIAIYEAEMNLIIHSDRGGIVRVQIEPYRILMQTTDNGPGIPDVKLALQAGWSTAPEEAREMGFGAGMGLVNIRRCVDRMELESTVGKGTKLLMEITLRADERFKESDNPNASTNPTGV